MKNSNKSISILTLALAIVFTASMANATQTASAKPPKTALAGNSLTNTVLGFDFKANTKGAFGINVTKVYENSAASNMGLKASDILLGIGETIVFESNVEETFKTLTPGADLMLRIERNGENEFVKAKMPALYDVNKKAAFLGVEMTPKNDKNSVGVAVKSVIENSTAQYAGLRKGDIILGLDNNVLVANNLNEVIAKYNAGDQAIIRIQRGKEVLMINTVLGMNEDPSIIINENSPITKH